jgi:dTDP-4-amino-4,6-dideoxygalactose transaminase
MTKDTVLDGSGPIVPFAGLRQQYHALRQEIDTAIRSVLERSAFIGGHESDELERWFADYCGVSHAIGVSSGSTAVELALRALGVGPGDEVVTAANTFIATAAAIVATAAHPVLVDVQERSANMDPERLCHALTVRAKAIVPVHLYGLPAPMDEICRIAGAAQAHGACYRGARLGSIGAAGCFSFYPAKNLGGFGDGGLVTTSSAKVADNVRLLRDHGRTTKYEHTIFGCTGRLDNLQAAILRVQAEYLDTWNAQRRRVAEWYREELPPEVVAFEDPEGQSVYHTSSR